eukprot:162553-Rhodomonas_salina.6
MSRKSTGAPAIPHQWQLDEMLSPADSARPWYCSSMIWSSQESARTAGPCDSTLFRCSRHSTSALRRKRLGAAAATVAAQTTHVAASSRDDHDRACRLGREDVDSAREAACVGQRTAQAAE